MIFILSTNWFHSFSYRFSVLKTVNEGVASAIGYDFGVDDLLGTIYDTAGLNRSLWPEKLFGSFCIFTSGSFLIDAIMSGIQMKA